MASPKIKVIVRYPVPAPDNPIFRELISVMHDELDILRRQYDKTTRTWTEESKPKWTKELKGVAPHFDMQITTSDKPFVWVDQGTHGGYVTFSKDYRPKTRPRVIGSRAGRGRVVRRGYGANAIKGVKAREFSDEIAQRRQKLFPKKAHAAILRGTRKFFRGYNVVVAP